MLILYILLICLSSIVANLDNRTPRPTPHPECQGAYRRGSGCSNSVLNAAACTPETGCTGRVRARRTHICPSTWAATATSTCRGLSPSACHCTLAARDCARIRHARRVVLRFPARVRHMVAGARPATGCASACWPCRLERRHEGRAVAAVHVRNATFLAGLLARHA